MIVEAGAYGTFALNILGMSDSITTTEKESASALFCTTIKNLKLGKSDSLTGKDNYCYINGRLFAIGEITFSGAVNARTKEWSVFTSKRRYENSKGWGPTIESIIVGGKEYKNNTGVEAVGDISALMITNTLAQNGNLDIVKKQLATKTVDGNKNRCVTSFGAKEDLPIDNSVSLRRFRCIGDWYGDSKNTTLGESNRGDDDCFRYRYKIDGSVMNLDNLSIKSNTTLSAVAIFGENHRNWSIDEVYLFWGPATGDMIKYTEKWPVETSLGATHWYDGDYEQTYKIMLSLPYEKSSATVESWDQIAELTDYIKSTTPAPAPEPEPDPEPTPEKPKFLDVSKNKWYGKEGGAIDFVVSNNIMAGTGKNTFSPDVDCDRAMMARIIYNCEKDPVAAKSNPFKDVEKKWYYDAVTWAAENKITNGISATTFGVNSKLTREQVAQFLYNYAKFLNIDTKSDADLSKYPDADKVSSWAVKAMKWANENGVVAGKSKDGQNYLDPTGNATRAEVAQMIKNFFDKYGE